MSDDTPPAERPEFDRLVFDLRALARQQETVTKAEAARRNATEMMRKAADLFAAGRISGAELMRLQPRRSVTSPPAEILGADG